MITPAVVRSAEREAAIFVKLWRASVFSMFVGPVLMLVAIGIGLGDLVDENDPSLGGLTYLEFVAPGLLVASVVQMAAGYSLWPVMAGHKWLGFHHAMVATSLRPSDVFGGSMMWAATRAAATASIFAVAAAAFGAVSSWWAIAAIPVAALTALAFAAPLAAFAASQDTDAAFDVIIRLVVMPLFLFSGAFFPTSQLPAALEVLTAAFPLWHAVEVARSATTGSGDLGPILGHLAVLFAYITIGWWLGVREFDKRLAS